MNDRRFLAIVPGRVRGRLVGYLGWAEMQSDGLGFIDYQFEGRAAKVRTLTRWGMNRKIRHLKERG